MKKLFLNDEGRLRSYFFVAVLYILIWAMLQHFETFVLSVFPALDWLYVDIFTRAIGTLVMLLMFSLVYKKDMRSTGFRSDSPVKDALVGALFGVIGIAAFFAAFAAFGVLRFGGVYPGNFFSLPVLVWLLAMIINSFFEETGYRGVMMSALRDSKNRYIIMIIPALLFSFGHCLNPGFSALAGVNLFLVGLYYGLLLVRSGNMLVPIGAHTTWNFFQMNVLGFNTSGLEGTSLLSFETGGSNLLLSGGEFGPEGSILCTGVMLLLLVLTAKFYKPRARKYWRMDEAE